MIRYIILSDKLSIRDGSKNFQDNEERYEFLVKSLFDLMQASKKGSIQKKIIESTNCARYTYIRKKI